MTTQNVTKKTITGKPADALDEAIHVLGAKNDAALARILKVQAPVISKTRNNKIPFGDTLSIRLSEVTGISASIWREKAGLPRYTTYPLES